MIFLGMGIAFAGYTIGLYGWILLKGVDISFKDLFVGSAWPPAPVPPGT